MKCLTNARAGGSLLLVILCVAVAVSVALSTAALVQSRQRLSDDSVRRVELRFAAEKALNEVLWQLKAHTNGVTHLAEPLLRGNAAAAEAIRAREPGVHVLVEDESARLCWPTCGTKSLAALLELHAGMDADTAMAQATAADEWFAAYTNRAETLLLKAPELTEKAESYAESTQTQKVAAVTMPCAPELLYEAELPEKEAFLTVLPHLSVYTDGKLNINTVGHDALCATVLGAGGSREGAEAIWQRLLALREKGLFFSSTSPTEAVALLQDGAMPSDEERRTLMLLYPKLSVDTKVWRIRVCAIEGRTQYRLQVVYEQEAVAFLRVVTQ